MCAGGGAIRGWWLGGIVLPNHLVLPTFFVSSCFPPSALLAVSLSLLPALSVFLPSPMPTTNTAPSGAGASSAAGASSSGAPSTAGPSTARGATVAAPTAPAAPVAATPNAAPAVDGGAATPVAPVVGTPVVAGVGTAVLTIDRTGTVVGGTPAAVPRAGPNQDALHPFVAEVAATKGGKAADSDEAMPDRRVRIIRPSSPEPGVPFLPAVTVGLDGTTELLPADDFRGWALPPRANVAWEGQGGLEVHERVDVERVRNLGRARARVTRAMTSRVTGGYQVPEFIRCDRTAVGLGDAYYIQTIRRWLFSGGTSNIPAGVRILLDNIVLQELERPGDLPAMYRGYIVEHALLVNTRRVVTYADWEVLRHERTERARFLLPSLDADELLEEVGGTADDFPPAPALYRDVPVLGALVFPALLSLRYFAHTVHTEPGPAHDNLAGRFARLVELEYLRSIVAALELDYQHQGRVVLQPQATLAFLRRHADETFSIFGAGYHGRRVRVAESLRRLEAAGALGENFVMVRPDGYTGNAVLYAIWRDGAFVRATRRIADTTGGRGVLGPRTGELAERAQGLLGYNIGGAPTADADVMREERGAAGGAAPAPREPEEVVTYGGPFTRLRTEAIIEMAPRMAGLLGRQAEKASLTVREVVEQVARAFAGRDREVARGGGRGRRGVGYGRAGARIGADLDGGRDANAWRRVAEREQDRNDALQRALDEALARLRDARADEAADAGRGRGCRDSQPFRRRRYDDGDYDGEGDDGGGYGYGFGGRA